MRNSYLLSFRCNPCSLAERKKNDGNSSENEKYEMALALGKPTQKFEIF